MEEGAAGQAGHTLAAFHHHQGPDIGAEVGKAWGRKTRLKDQKQRQRLGRKETLHHRPPGCAVQHTTGDPDRF